MSVGFSTKERTVQTGSLPQQPAMELDRVIAYFFICVTLCIASFFIYGGRNEMPRIQRNSTPVHILHYDSMLSGNAQKTY